MASMNDFFDVGAYLGTDDMFDESYDGVTPDGTNEMAPHGEMHSLYTEAFISQENSMMKAPQSVPETYDPALFEENATNGLGSVLGKRPREETISSPLTPDEAAAESAAGPSRPAKRRGQLRGWPQAWKIHKQFCSPWTGCSEKCKVQSNFPNQWTSKQKTLSTKQRNPHVPDNCQIELWKEYADDTLQSQAYAGDRAGHTMPQGQAARDPNKVVRTRLADGQ